MDFPLLLQSQRSRVRCEKFTLRQNIFKLRSAHPTHQKSRFIFVLMKVGLMEAIVILA